MDSCVDATDIRLPLSPSPKEISHAYTGDLHLRVESPQLKPVEDAFKQAKALLEQIRRLTNELRQLKSGLLVPSLSSAAPAPVTTSSEPHLHTTQDANHTDSTELHEVLVSSAPINHAPTTPAKVRFAPTTAFEPPDKVLEAEHPRSVSNADEARRSPDVKQQRSVSSFDVTGIAPDLNFSVAALQQAEAAIDDRSALEMMLRQMTERCDTHVVSYFSATHLFLWGGGIQFLVGMKRRSRRILLYHNVLTWRMKLSTKRGHGHLPSFLRPLICFKTTKKSKIYAAKTMNSEYFRIKLIVDFFGMSRWY